MTTLWQRQMRFALIGTLGFAVDWSLFNSLLWAEVQPLPARMVAFVCAALTTWLGNRTLTFADRTGKDALQQAGQYLLMVMLSLLPNLTTFSLLFAALGSGWWGMQLALVSGVFAGMISNYLISERWIFAKGDQLVS